MDEENLKYTEIVNKGGRPLRVDMSDPEVAKQIAFFGQIHATHEEMAACLDVDVRTIERYMANKEGEFCRVYKTNQGDFKKSLRRMQIEKAQKGDSTMLIWLGKQILGQKDVKAVDNRYVDKEGNDIVKSDYDILKDYGITIDGESKRLQ